MAGRLAPSPFTLTRGKVNCYRYQLAVVVHGSRVLRQVFLWTYQGGQQYVKDYFLSLGKSNSDFRSKFNSKDRIKLDTGHSDDYDVSLLYTLLQEVCGLDQVNDWKTPSQSLEHLIYKLKTKRNDVAHSKDLKSIHDSDLRILLTELKDLLDQILQQAGFRMQKSTQDVQNLIDDIEDDFQNLLNEVREPLSPSSHLDLPQLREEIQDIRLIRDLLKDSIKNEIHAELLMKFPEFWDVSLAQGLYANYNFRPSLNFTNLVIHEDSWNCPSSLEHNPVPIQDLLIKTRPDGKLPNVLILAGDGGIGKTTLLKYMMEKWVTDLNNTSIRNINNYTPLLYFQLRLSTISSWKDLLKNLLYDTFQNSGLHDEFFADIVLGLDPLVLLDGYDEANQESKQLVQALLGLPGKIRLIITTRLSGLEELITIARILQKREMVVKIMGTRQVDRQFFVRNTLTQIIADENRVDELQTQILRGLEVLANDNNSFDVPLIVTMYVIREVQTTTQPSGGDVYEDLTKLMMVKVKERLIVKGISNAGDKTFEFLQFLQKISLRCLKQREFDLSPDTVQTMKEYCNTLMVPWDEMLSAFLTSKKSMRGMDIFNIWSFPHKTFQEFWATGYIIHKLKASTRTAPVDISHHNNLVLNVYAEDPEEARVLFNRESEEAKLFVDIVCNAAQLMKSKSDNLLDRISQDVINSVILCGCKRDDILSGSALWRILEATHGHSSIATACKVSLQNYSTITISEDHRQFPNGLIFLFSLIDQNYVIMKDHKIDLAKLDISYRPDPTTMPRLFTTSIECIHLNSPPRLTGSDIRWWLETVKHLQPPRPTRINVAIHLSSSGSEEGEEEETAVSAMLEFGIKADRLLLTNERELNRTKKEEVIRLATDTLKVCRMCTCLEYGWWCYSS